MWEAVGKGGESAPRLVVAAGTHERFHTQCLALLCKPSVREPMPVLRKQHECVDEFVARILRLRALQ